MPDTTAYKVLTTDQKNALETGAFKGAPVDLQDGFIHLSTADQIGETIDRHFPGQEGLWLAAVDLEALGDAVRWEASRGGQLFPHLYGALPLNVVTAYSELHYEADGSLRLPVTG
ncbi:DUF952 domain-containing protein [Sphingomonas sp.]|jgi:uncharacterized protein (DUF952 family)|uniref:DUF952 domain-containing protein n=1 Tax=Sphingomonas sp. TaxID=28214 RepID=UPI002EDB4C3B